MNYSRIRNTPSTLYCYTYTVLYNYCIILLLCMMEVYDYDFDYNLLLSLFWGTFCLLFFLRPYKPDISKKERKTLKNSSLLNGSFICLTSLHCAKNKNYILIIRLLMTISPFLQLSAVIETFNSMHIMHGFHGTHFECTEEFVSAVYMFYLYCIVAVSLREMIPSLR